MSKIIYEKFISQDFTNYIYGVNMALHYQRKKKLFFLNATHLTLLFQLKKIFQCYYLFTLIVGTSLSRVCSNTT